VLGGVHSGFAPVAPGQAATARPERSLNAEAGLAAILAEVDYLAATRLGEKVARAFAEDLSSGVFRVEGLAPRDLTEAWALMKRYPRLPLGLVDAIVMVHAERLKARAIVTLDLRHFRAVKLKGNPKLLPHEA
jgi:predicted nucleic acid-binding protein